MKPLYLFLALPALLAACADLAPTEAPSAGQTNAAATFCSKSGGKVVPKQDAASNEGWCQLPSGLLVDEWSFYLQAHPTAKG